MNPARRTAIYCEHCTNGQCSVNPAPPTANRTYYASPWQALRQERDFPRTCTRLLKECGSISGDIFFILCIPYLLSGSLNIGTMQDVKTVLDGVVAMVSVVDVTLDLGRQGDICKQGLYAAQRLRQAGRKDTTKDSPEENQAVPMAQDTATEPVRSRRPSATSMCSFHTACEEEPCNVEEDPSQDSGEGSSLDSEENSENDEEDHVSAQPGCSYSTAADDKRTTPGESKPPLPNPQDVEVGDDDAEDTAAAARSRQCEFKAKQILLILKAMVALLRILRFLLALITLIVKLIRLLMLLLHPRNAPPNSHTPP